MNNKYDLSKFISTPTIESISNDLVKRVKERRKELKLTQKELALRSNVSYASLRRFESSGEISLSSLLKVAQALGTLDEFNNLFSNEIITTLKDY